jgi:hypothetical protein
MTNHYAACFLLWAIFAQAAAADRDTWLAQTTLPQQARLCDVAGVGTVIAGSASNVVVHVDTWWLGEGETNVLGIVSDELEMPIPSAETVVVFFATTNIHYRSHLTRAEQEFVDPGVSPYHWDYPRARTNALPSTGLSFFGAHRGWFPADEGNGQVMAFASNLVQCVRVQPSAQAYYSLLRNNGTGWTAPERIVQDVRYSLWMSSYFDGTNILSLMVADTNLDARIRSSAEVRLSNLAP